MSRDESLLSGGISGASLKAGQEVDAVPIAWLTPAGDWKPIRCAESRRSECLTFERDYLSKSHLYTVVSSDGWGARVRVAKMALDKECFGYGGQGTSSGATIPYAAVATNPTDVFTNGGSAKRVKNKNVDPLRKAFKAAVANKLDSAKELRFYSLQLESQRLFVVQRAFQDYASKLEDDATRTDLDAVFAIGAMKRGRFHLLSWQNEVDSDQNEQMLGTIHLRNGKDFLVNTVSDPEQQFFRVHGLRGGRLTLVYHGGGGSC